MRGVRALVVCGLVLVPTSGCGLGAALGEQPTSSAATSTSAAVPAPSAAAPAAPADMVLAAVPLGGPAGDDELTVTRERTQTGLVPPMPEWPTDCPVDYAALQYVPVQLAVTGPELAGHLTVTTTAATPTDIGTIGVFFSGSAEPYCRDDPAFQLADTFWSHGNGGRTTAYVVLQDAVTPATPEGRPDVFGTLQLRIDDLRVHSGGDLPFTPGIPTVGALCPDDDDAICVPLP